MDTYIANLAVSWCNRSNGEKTYILKSVIRNQLYRTPRNVMTNLKLQLISSVLGLTNNFIWTQPGLVTNQQPAGTYYYGSIMIVQISAMPCINQRMTSPRATQIQTDCTENVWLKVTYIQMISHGMQFIN
jgi:hypothetical protein